MVARDAALAGYEGGRIHIQHLSAASSRSRRSRRPRTRGVQVTCEASPHHLCLTERGRPRAGHADEDEPAAAHRGRPPGADRRPALGRRSTASPPTTPRTRATRRRSRSSRRRWARPAWRPRSPRSTPSSSSPACSTLALVVERMTAGGELFGTCRRRASRVGEAANLVLVDLDAEWEVGEDGYESRSEQLLLRRARRCAGACCSRSPPAASPTASGPSRWRRHERARRLRPARGRHALRRRRVRRRRRQRSSPARSSSPPA